ncbi:hypothetical protein GCM10022240_27580 [Microbacterium kribbense]|uniref:Uncharacterized protein n=1 Tax=Microbacterium kribbense TaxID=433645 RepID=A0ABP7GUM5_9MICO
MLTDAVISATGPRDAALGRARGAPLGVEPLRWLAVTAIYAAHLADRHEAMRSRDGRPIVKLAGRISGP